MDAAERARRYVAKMPDLRRAEDDPQDSHSQLLTAAIALVNGFDLAPQSALQLLTEYAQRSDQPWTLAELQRKIDQAQLPRFADDKPRGYLLGDDPAPGKVIPFCAPDVTAPAERKAVFENHKLKDFAKQWRDAVTTAWLADRSAVDPFRLPSGKFLEQLYRPGEFVVVFTLEFSQGQALWPRDEIPRTGPNGVWFLSQPVDGKSHPNPRSLDKDRQPKLSRRSEESVTSWRYLVLESDQADARDWIGALVQLPLAIAAIYTSGKRSIHALVRVDAPSLHEWRNFSNAIKPILVTLGADRQVVASAVRLSRLPGCLREGSADKDGIYSPFKGGARLQKLLYLNPNPSVKAICTLPKLRDCVEHWTSAALKHLSRDAGEIIECYLKSKRAQYDEKTNTFRNVDLNDCIEALARAENIELSESIDDCLFALEWFSTAPAALEMLEKIRARRGT